MTTETNRRGAEDAEKNWTPVVPVDEQHYRFALLNVVHAARLLHTFDIPTMLKQNETQQRSDIAEERRELLEAALPLFRLYQKGLTKP
jgi:hypothetical protein